ncbi:MAG: response regulator transcription factor [Desulfobulbaceae bacterium]|nr:response regulator transcription factor [Desulfobulbaceae bacterium]
MIGEAADGSETIKLCSELKPDIVLMDVNLGDMDGIVATSRIVANDPETIVLGLSMFQDEEVAQAMQQAGATAFLTKGVPSAHLLSAIHNVMAINGMAPDKKRVFDNQLLLVLSKL